MREVRIVGYFPSEKGLAVGNQRDPSGMMLKYFILTENTVILSKSIKGN